MPPKTDPRPIRVYKRQCDVEKRKTKEIDLGAHLMRIIIRKALRRVALVYLVCLSVSLLPLCQLYQIGSIFRCQLIIAVKFMLDEGFCQDSVTQFLYCRLVAFGY